MKKTLLFMAAFIYITVNYLNAQVIANFEPTGPLTIHVMGCGAWDDENLYPVSETFMVVDNPDPTGINPSSKVMKFVRRGTDNGGSPWGGFWANCFPMFDVSVNKYVHVKVWKPRISPVKFKLEGGTSGTLEIASMNTQSAANEWVDMVFDFTTMDGTYPVIAFMPDFEDPLTVADDQEIYFDDIIVNSDPTPLGGKSVITNFENMTFGPLTLHVLGCGDWDNPDLHPVAETFKVIGNPDPSGINTSSKVVKFTRQGTNNGALPWGGFWANCNPNADVTNFKYVHVKVWKPRISPVKFKLEGGAAGTLEIASTNAQTVTGVWEDMVFDFSSKTGTYPIIALLPDFEDPLTLTDPIDIFFDDIIINSDPNPIIQPEVVFLDFEDGTTGPLNLHVMGNGLWDDENQHAVTETFLIIDNPDASGINVSTNVMKFTRRGADNGGLPWGGFWANCNPGVDATNNKYVHVMVWKPRISPLKFKLEGGPSGTLETFSMNAQPESNEWVDMVFDFSSMTGVYPVVAFMPDFEDPFTAITDQEIYFDNIRITDNSIPVGIKDHGTTASGFTLYPNPCSGQLTVMDAKDVMQIAVYNLIGEKVITVQSIPEGDLQIDMTNLVNGLYLLSFTKSNGEVSTAKIIKN